MSLILDGTNGLTFNNATTQASAGLTAASPTIASGVLTYPNGATNGGYINGGTAQASTSGTSIDFTNIPSWVKRITVMFNKVSTNGTAGFALQLGTSSGVETTGYTATGSYAGPTNAAGGSTSTTSFITFTIAAANLHSGHFVFTLVGSNIWVCSYTTVTDSSYMYVGGGSKTTSGTLDRVRITTVNGTDTFDAGSINIIYE